MAARGKPFEPGNPGGGRKQGSKNKIPRSMKDRVVTAMEALDKKGLSLTSVAKENPKWFYSTFGPLMIPKAVEVTGKDGEAIRHEHALAPQSLDILSKLVGGGS